ncbi:MAG: hypothetical protein ACJA2S_001604 [Cyclobacteriaceae bacterium]|jgi:hypothetical protein
MSLMSFFCAQLYGIVFTSMHSFMISLIGCFILLIWVYSILVASGKHGQAQQAYESFTKNYRSLYAEPVGVEYQELLEIGGE